MRFACFSDWSVWRTVVMERSLSRLILTVATSSGQPMNITFRRNLPRHRMVIYVLHYLTSVTWASVSCYKISNGGFRWRKMLSPWQCVALRGPPAPPNYVARSTGCLCGNATTTSRTHHFQRTTHWLPGLHSISAWWV